MTDLHALIGRTLGGRYRIEALLGRGGFGAVYRAMHLELDRTVAIKTLVAGEAAASHMQARFRREARVQAELRHASVVQLLDFGREPDGTCYMVQEFVAGRTLKESVEHDGPMAPARAARIVCQALDGLSAAHRRGIVHRDIKPANIMLADGHDGEEVRLLDFGIAKLRDAVDESQTLTVQGQILGTPAFMAPEQIQQAPPSPATDVYAIGGVLYYLLSGQKPFRGGLHAVLTAHLMQPAPKLPPGPCEVFDAVVARAMAKAPAARYASADEMRRAVDAAAAALSDAVAAGGPTDGSAGEAAAIAGDASADTWVTPARDLPADQQPTDERRSPDPAEGAAMASAHAAAVAPRRRRRVVPAAALLMSGAYIAWFVVASDAPPHDPDSARRRERLAPGQQSLGEPTAAASPLAVIGPPAPAAHRPDAPLADPEGPPADAEAPEKRLAPVEPPSPSPRSSPAPTNTGRPMTHEPRAGSRGAKRAQRAVASTARQAQPQSAAPPSLEPPASPPRTASPVAPPVARRPDATTASPREETDPSPSAAESPATSCDVRPWQLLVRGALDDCACDEAAALLARIEVCDREIAATLAASHRRRCASKLPGACR